MVVTGLDSIFDSSLDLRKDHLSTIPDFDYLSDSSVDLLKTTYLRPLNWIMHLTVL